MQCVSTILFDSFARSYIFFLDSRFLTFVLFQNTRKRLNLQIIPAYLKRQVAMKNYRTELKVQFREYWTFIGISLMQKKQENLETWRSLLPFFFFSNSLSNFQGNILSLKVSWIVPQRFLTNFLRKENWEKFDTISDVYS